MLPQTSYVLFVDDDPEDQEIMRDCCYELQLAEKAYFIESGEALFRFLSTLQHATEFPSLIVLDVNMPGMNGEETLLRLKRDARYRHIPVVFYSTGSRSHSRFAELGADGYYSKPNNYRQVRESLKTFFAHLEPPTDS